MQKTGWKSYEVGAAAPAHQSCHSGAQLLQVRRQRVSPLVLAIKSPCLDSRDSPGILETLLLGNCDSNGPEVSMTAALRILDTQALVSLLIARPGATRSDFHTAPERM